MDAEDQIEVAIVIKVAECRAAGPVLAVQRIPFEEFAELIGFGISAVGLAEKEAIAVSDEKVRLSVVVQVSDRVAKAEQVVGESEVRSWRLQI